MSLGFRKRPLCGERQAEAVMGFREFGFQAQGFTVEGRRLIVTAPVAKCVGEIMQGLGPLWFASQCLAETVSCFVRLTLVEESQALLMQGLRLSPDGPRGRLCRGHRACWFDCRGPALYERPYLLACGQFEVPAGLWPIRFKAESAVESACCLLK